VIEAIGQAAIDLFKYTQTVCKKSTNWAQAGFKKATVRVTKDLIVSMLERRTPRECRTVVPETTGTHSVRRGKPPKPPKPLPKGHEIMVTVLQKTRLITLLNGEYKAICYLSAKELGQVQKDFNITDLPPFQMFTPQGIVEIDLE